MTTRPVNPVTGLDFTPAVGDMPFTPLQRELLSADRSEADLPPSDGVDGGADDKDGKNEKDDASSSSSPLRK